MLDRKPLANHAVRKKQGSSALPAHVLVAHTPDHQVQLRPCSSADSSPVLLRQGPGNAYSVEPGQGTPAYGCHRSGSVLPLWDERGQVVPLDATLAASSKTLVDDQCNVAPAYH